MLNEIQETVHRVRQANPRTIHIDVTRSIRNRTNHHLADTTINTRGGVEAMTGHIMIPDTASIFDDTAVIRYRTTETVMIRVVKARHVLKSSRTRTESTSSN